MVTPATPTFHTGSAAGESFLDFTLPDQSGAPRTCPVLIGRDAMLRALKEMFARAHDGSGGIALLSGEAGIGKSRLVAQLLTDSGADADAPVQTILRGNCFEPDRTLPYAPSSTSSIPSSAPSRRPPSPPLSAWPRPNWRTSFRLSHC